MIRMTVLAALALLLALPATLPAQGNCMGAARMRLYSTHDGVPVQEGSVIGVEAQVSNLSGHTLWCDVSWSVSGPARVRSTSGTAAEVLATGPGTITVQARIRGMNASTSRRFRVLEQPLMVEVQPDSLVLEMGAERQMQVVLTNDAGQSFTGRGARWESDNPAVARVDSVGVVTAVGPGTAVIQATVQRGQRLAPRQASTRVTVVAKKE